MPSGVVTIGYTSLYGCTALVEIIIPDSVTKIDRQAFIDCGALTSIQYHGTMEQWNAVVKVSGWNGNTGEYIVRCSDGDIPKA